MSCSGLIDRIARGLTTVEDAICVQNLLDEKLSGTIGICPYCLEMMSIDSLEARDHWKVCSAGNHPALKEIQHLTDKLDHSLALIAELTGLVDVLRRKLAALVFEIERNPVFSNHFDDLLIIKMPGMYDSEMSSFIATEIMGWQKRKISASWGDLWVWEKPTGEYVSVIRYCPEVNLADAMSALKQAALLFDFSFRITYDSSGFRMIGTEKDGSPFDYALGEKETLPLKICEVIREWKLQRG